MKKKEQQGGETKSKSRTDSVRIPRLSDFTPVQGSRIFSSARAELAREIQSYSVDPYDARISESWGRLSNQVVGHEQLD